MVEISFATFTDLHLCIVYTALCRPICAQPCWQIDASNCFILQEKVSTWQSQLLQTLHRWLPISKLSKSLSTGPGNPETKWVSIHYSMGHCGQPKHLPFIELSSNRIQNFWLFIKLLQNNKQISSKVQISATATIRKQNTKSAWNQWLKHPLLEAGFHSGIWGIEGYCTLPANYWRLFFFIEYTSTRYSIGILIFLILIYGKLLQSVYTLLNHESPLSVDEIEAKIFHPIFSECILGQQNRQKFANTLTHS